MCMSDEVLIAFVSTLKIEREDDVLPILLRGIINVRDISMTMTSGTWNDKVVIDDGFICLSGTAQM